MHKSMVPTIVPFDLVQARSDSESAEHRYFGLRLPYSDGPQPHILLLTDSPLVSLVTSINTYRTSLDIQSVSSHSTSNFACMKVSITILSTLRGIFLSKVSGLGYLIQTSHFWNACIFIIVAVGILLIRIVGFCTEISALY